MGNLRALYDSAPFSHQSEKSMSWFLLPVAERGFRGGVVVAKGTQIFSSKWAGSHPH